MSLLRHGTHIPVISCDKFMTDEKFKSTRELLEAKDPLKWKRIKNHSNPSEVFASHPLRENIIYSSTGVHMLINAPGYTSQDITVSLGVQSINILAEHIEPDAPAVTTGSQTGQSMSKSVTIADKINPTLAKAFLSSDGLLIVYAPFDR